MNQTANNVSRGNPANQRRIISSLLIGFALLILIVVLLRRFLDLTWAHCLERLSASQALIVGTAIYALFVPPYDKKRRRLSRAGFVTIFSFLIAFGAFALSDWKDRVDARKAGDDGTETNQGKLKILMILSRELSLLRTKANRDQESLHPTDCDFEPANRASKGPGSTRKGRPESTGRTRCAT